jgi:RNA polymerase sigma factor (sigma-70 family)
MAGKRRVHGVSDGALRIETEGPLSFEHFYEASYALLQRLAYARTGDWAAGEDLVQDALADAHRRWPEVGAYDDPLAWARRAVLNRAAGRWRRLDRESRALRRVHGRAQADPPEGFELRDEELWRCIRRLPRRQLEVVLLLWFEELSVSEVSASLGCGEESVRTHWRRARGRLSEALDRGGARELADDDTEGNR